MEQRKETKLATKGKFSVITFKPKVCGYKKGEQFQHADHVHI